MTTHIKDAYAFKYTLRSRQTVDGKQSVLLTIYDRRTQKRSYLSTQFALTPDQFKTVTTTGSNPRGSNREIKMQLDALMYKAHNVASSLSAFDITQFKTVMSVSKASQDSLYSAYENRIDRLRRLGKNGTALNYACAMKYLMKAQNHKPLTFLDVTPAWLEDLEAEARDTGLSMASLSMYLRTLRTLFNEAIRDGNVPADAYPFGKGKYLIPSGQNIKKALTVDEVRVMMNADIDIPAQERARDFFIISYLCSGMNLRDLLHLRCKNIDGNTLRFERIKTKGTKRMARPIELPLHQKALDLINIYGNSQGSPDAYVFPYLRDCKSDQERFDTSRNFNTSISKALKRLARDIGLPQEVSIIWARHTYATIMMNKGASMELVGETMGHTSIKTTQQYFKGFDSEIKKSYTDRLLDL